MKNPEILALSDEALNEQIKTEKANSQNMRFAHAISPLENPIRLKHSRKNIARLLTEQTRRKNEQANNTAN